MGARGTDGEDFGAISRDAQTLGMLDDLPHDTLPHRDERMHYTSRDHLRAQITFPALALARKRFRLTLLAVDQDHQTSDCFGRESLLIAKQERYTIGGGDSQITLDRDRRAQQNKARRKNGAHSLSLTYHLLHLQRLQDRRAGQIVEQGEIINYQVAAIRCGNQSGSQRAGATQQSQIEIDSTDKAVLGDAKRNLHKGDIGVDMITGEMREGAEEGGLAGADGSGEYHTTQRGIDKRTE